ncbi:hypothetical protein PM082_004781 [Marasmius tenuissimus]|nr:hypothetical protein PM082_004781 [Marasmius tenuissimus]
MKTPSPTTPPPQEVVDLTKTNEIPSNRGLLRQQHGELKSRLSTLRNQINQVQQLLVCLREEEARVKAYVETYRVALHPLRALPADVLLEIFHNCNQPAVGRKLDITEDSQTTTH